MLPQYEDKPLSRPFYDQIITPVEDPAMEAMSGDEQHTNPVLMAGAVMQGAVRARTEAIVEAASDSLVKAIAARTSINLADDLAARGHFKAVMIPLIAKRRHTPCSALIAELMHPKAGY